VYRAGLGGSGLHSDRFLIKTALNAITFEPGDQLRRTFFKMKVISVAFMMDMFGFRDLECELLGMLKRRWLGIPTFFPVK
jgi:hypothetical protein